MTQGVMASNLRISRGRGEIIHNLHVVFLECIFLKIHQKHQYINLRYTYFKEKNVQLWRLFSFFAD